MPVQRNLPACSNIYVRTMVFTHMCQTNVPLLIIFGKFEDPVHPSLTPLPVYQFLQFSKTYIKTYIYPTISHRCSLTNSLRIFGTPNSGGTPLYMKYNAHFAIQLYIYP